MLDKESLENEAAAFISIQLDILAGTIQPGSDLKSMGLDSFRIIELVLFLERKTGLSFPDNAYTPFNLRSVETLVECFLNIKK